MNNNRMMQAVIAFIGVLLMLVTYRWVATDRRLDAVEAGQLSNTVKIETITATNDTRWDEVKRRLTSIEIKLDGLASEGRKR